MRQSVDWSCSNRKSTSKQFQISTRTAIIHHSYKSAGSKCEVTYDYIVIILPQKPRPLTSTVTTITKHTQYISDIVIWTN